METHILSTSDDQMLNQIFVSYLLPLFQVFIMEKVWLEIVFITVFKICLTMVTFIIQSFESRVNFRMYRNVIR